MNNEQFYPTMGDLLAEVKRRNEILEADNQLAWNTCDKAETRVRKLEAGLNDIMLKGYSTYHGKGYSLATIAQQTLKEAEL